MSKLVTSLWPELLAYKLERVNTLKSMSLTCLMNCQFLYTEELTKLARERTEKF